MRAKGPMRLFLRGPKLNRRMFSFSSSGCYWVGRGCDATAAGHEGDENQCPEMFVRLRIVVS